MRLAAGRPAPVAQSDKLLDEAIHSDLVSVREFLKRLDTLSDAGARGRSGQRRAGAPSAS